MTTIFLTNGLPRQTTLSINAVRKLINNTDDDYIEIETHAVGGQSFNLLINKNTISTIEDKEY